MQNHAYRSRQPALPLAAIFAAIVLAVGTLFGSSGAANAQQTTASSDRIWQDLKGDVFGDRAILVDSGVVR
ncbi:MAG: quinoprotein dehydrogenase-associated SoxYZ-like carrier, partial [Mesorhizobium sp.]